MKNIMALTFFLFPSFFSFSLFAEWQQGLLELPEGRKLAYEYHRGTDSSPVLLFLPGIYRGSRSDDEFVTHLVKARLSFVLMHFSAHPDSIAESEPSRRPDFSQLEVKDLAQEVKSLALALKLKNPVPVTLSYSAILTTSLDKKIFPVVIESAPIGKDTDGLPPQVALLYENWRAWLGVFPYGEAWLRANKRIYLRSEWQPWVERYGKRLAILKNPEYKERAIQGYIALTLASEKFDLRDQDFRKGPQRYFILGEEEEENRAALQDEAIEKYQSQTRHRDNVYFIEKSGHVVSADQPQLYVRTLKAILKSL
jgi:hypothetical protein